MMLKVKTFDTKEKLDKFVKKHHLLWREIHLANVPYAIEFEYMKNIKVVSL